jgi:hypothetical protein
MHGIGPICRVSKKVEDYEEKTQNLFANRAEYDYGFDGRILWIEDLGGLKSVTNDIENILADIAILHGVSMIKGKHIMYKDSMGIWDGINAEVTEIERFGTASISVNRISFFPITEIDKRKAKQKLLTIETV